MEMYSNRAKYKRSLKPNSRYKLNELTASICFIFFLFLNFDMHSLIIVLIHFDKLGCRRYQYDQPFQAQQNVGIK